MKFINLKRFRKERGLTQNQLGKALKLPQSTISYLENGLQEVTDCLIECIKRTFSVDNLEDYVYERNNFHESERSHHIKEEVLSRIFSMDWDYANPIDILDGLPVVCKTGLINIAKDGTMVIDRNNGIGFRLGYYIIPPKQFIREDLLLSITTKDWFDLDMFEDFKRAYYIGCKVAGIQPVKQLKEVANHKLDLSC